MSTPASTDSGRHTMTKSARASVLRPLRVSRYTTFTPVSFWCTDWTSALRVRRLASIARWKPFAIWSMPPTGWNIVPVVVPDCGGIDRRRLVNAPWSSALSSYGFPSPRAVKAR